MWIEAENYIDSVVDPDEPPHKHNYMIAFKPFSVFEHGTVHVRLFGGEMNNI